MGEYAIRKSDNVEIKIGTCKSMYYLRYEDRAKVQHLSGNVDPANDPEGLLFRLPFDDEDDILPGEYDDYNRGLRLYRRSATGYAEDFQDLSTLSDPGTMQLRHENSGLLLNVPCYHGIQLPEVVKPMSAFWNGKGHSFEMTWLKCMKLQDDLQIVLPVVRCRHCGHAWRYEWSTLWPFIPYKMQLRLRDYAKWEDPALAAVGEKRADTN